METELQTCGSDELLAMVQVLVSIILQGMGVAEVIPSPVEESELFSKEPDLPGEVWITGTPSVSSIVA